MANNYACRTPPRAPRPRNPPAVDRGRSGRTGFEYRLRRANDLLIARTAGLSGTARVLFPPQPFEQGQLNEAESALNGRLAAIVRGLSRTVLSRTNAAA